MRGKLWSDFSFQFDKERRQWNFYEHIQFLLNLWIYLAEGEKVFSCVWKIFHTEKNWDVFSLLLAFTLESLSLRFLWIRQTFSPSLKEEDEKHFYFLSLPFIDTSHKSDRNQWNIGDNYPHLLSALSRNSHVYRMILHRIEVPKPQQRIPCNLFKIFFVIKRLRMNPQTRRTSRDKRCLDTNVFFLFNVAII